MSRQRIAIVILVLITGSRGKPVSGLDVLFDFEGDVGNLAIDKLTNDRAQNGVLLNQVGFTSSDAPFGGQAAFFDVPQPPDEDDVPPFSTIEIPGTDFGVDYSMTIAMHVNNRESESDFTRLVSSFQGTGPVPTDRLIFDMDPTGSSGVTGLRAVVNSTVVMTPFIPDGLGDPGYHHYAMTVDAGDVALFFNGEEVYSDFVGLGYSNDAVHQQTGLPVHLHIGEDPHDGGGSADEQLKGSIDDVLVIDRVLSDADIRLLAGGNPVPAVVQPNAQDRAVYYNFESDVGDIVSDKFIDDGAQDAVTHRMAIVDQEATNAKLGSQSGYLKHPLTNSEATSIFSQIDLGEVGSLGDQFTLSAVVNVAGGGHPSGGLTRLFSSFRGTGPILDGELIFDFDPHASVEDIGMRLVLPGGSQVIANNTFSVDQNHTLTAVYDDGDVALYLDGRLVKEDTVAIVGAIDLGSTPLKIGEDNGGNLNENFQGTMDDVLILSRALRAADVETLANDGAASFLGLSLTGDYNQNGQLDVEDINLLVWESGSGDHLAHFDLTGDKLVNVQDVSFWITELAKSWIGDADLNLQFDEADLVEVFVAGKYLTDEDAGWNEGDWNGDHRFDSQDIVAAFVDGGYLMGPRPALQAVPEPTTWAMWLLSLVALSSWFRRVQDRYEG